MGIRNKSETDYAEFIAKLEARGLYDSILHAAKDRHVTLRELYMGPRTALLSRARAAVWRTLRHIGWSEVEIGALFDVHHTTVHDSLQRDLTPKPVAEPFVEVVVEGVVWAWFRASMRHEAEKYASDLRERYKDERVEIL